MNAALFTHAWRGVFRNPTRTLTYLLGLILAVGLFADVLFFVDVSQRGMTATALAPVQVDMVARATTPELSPTALETALRSQPLVKTAQSVASAEFASLSKVGGASTTAGSSTAAGKVFALPANYFTTFDFLPVVSGRYDLGGAMIGDATATQLGLKVGDRVQVNFAAGLTAPYVTRISGIVGMGASEPLFYTPDPAGAEGYGVVADVLFLPPATFERDLAPALKALPVTTSSVGQTGSNVVLLPVERQVHLKIDRASLAADPAKALKQLDSLRRALESPFPGQVRVTNNLSKKLDNAKKDILAAKMLFIFLTLPGVALGAYLSKYATELASEPLRRDLSQLRVRGAGSREVLLVTAYSALIIAALGSALGLVFGAGVLAAVLGPSIYSGANLGLIGPSALWAVLAGLVLTLLAFFLPAWGLMRAEIAGNRSAVTRTQAAPLWRRMNLDVLLLIGAAVVLYVTNANGGFKPTGTEGTAVTLSFYLFLAPFMFWIGMTLLLIRGLNLLLTRGAGHLTRALQHLLGDLGLVAARSLTRRSGAISSAVTLTALTLSFGVALALFLGTYASQKRSDIQYVVGSDVRVTPPAIAGLTPRAADQLAALPGVSAATAVARDPVALIGSEKKSVYGIDVPSFQKAAFLPDVFFESGLARKDLAALAATPNGVLLARDQADKFNINVGDPVLMRLYNPKTAQYVQVKSKAVGIYTYFPTSSQDADFVLNRAFFTAATGTSGADLFLVKTPDATAVAQAIQASLGRTHSLKIDTVLSATKVDESSLTSLNLAGLGRLEQLYTALIVAASLGIFLISMLQTRRKEFGTMRALGSDERQLRTLVSAEAFSISGLSLLAGLAIGASIASLFVMLLRVIFLIPPTGLTWPLGELGLLFALALVGMGLGTLLANRHLAGLRISEVLREG